jgi:hypothetical protein
LNIIDLFELYSDLFPPPVRGFLPTGLELAALGNRIFDGVDRGVDLAEYLLAGTLQ